MKVRTLIELLKHESPNAQVVFHVATTGQIYPVNSFAAETPTPDVFVLSSAVADSKQKGK